MNLSIFVRIVTVYFKIINKLNQVIKTLVSDRKTSFPYLACDTYAIESTLSLDSKDDISLTLEAYLKKIPLKAIYVNCSGLTQLKCYLEQSKHRKYSRTLVIGDSDRSIESSELLPFIDYFDEIYATNLLNEELEMKIHGIPIGLENKFYRYSGLLGTYRKIPNFKIEYRKLGILVSWNDNTFQEYRTNVRRELSCSTNVKLIHQRVPFQVIHHLTRKSLIVACPRGNGVDTHRIWESLYLGAVPVITRYDFLPVFENWPIHVIDSWSELANMSRRDLENIYEQHFNQLIIFREKSKIFLKELFYE